ncbi:MAG: RNA-directed DNA polymerase [Bacteroidaceae bacterium]|nr:RNA-directed DNA polymerase [Bacteroidaceae bacterium]
MTLSRQQLLLDLYQAFYDAKRHKSKRSYVRAWEKNLTQNMEELCDDLYYRRYKPLPSKCFIIDYPKKREIFAAMFRDRIVHHLYFNYTHSLYERTFIQDSYSCIKNRGTHYGIGRITDFCRKESRNWQRKCYVMHLDIRGYFMHIDRKRLLEIAVGSLRKMAAHRISKCSERTWYDVLDMELITWLTEIIVLLNPKENCVICGELSDWIGLDPAKSMLHLEDGLGLPIGNLTSQLFSNVYLNVFDQFMKRDLKCRYYGRYVDDAAVVNSDKEWLLSLVPRIRHFLRAELGLELHMGKLEITEVHRGVEFLGAYIKPWRTYISNHALGRMRQKIAEIDFSKPWRVLRSVNSYLGIFRHTSSYRLSRHLLMGEDILRIGIFNEEMTKYTDRKLFYKQQKFSYYEQSIRKKDGLRPHQGGRKPGDYQLRLRRSRRGERHMAGGVPVQEADVQSLPF